MIRVLPGNIASMIAAGEVVQRPASALKELLENALDAGAFSVNVVVKDAGRTLIRVVDNGCGMSAEDAALCFERHATSKISSADDLQDIHTFGFRGEALPSIAAVSSVTLKTRREEDEVGSKLSLSPGSEPIVEQVACPKGSCFEVRDLFFNVPARRKFLKSDNIELKHLLSEFTRVALTRPDVSFTFTSDGKDLFVLKAAKSLKFRIQDLLGSGAASDVLDVCAQTSVVKIDGFIGRPEGAKKGMGNQYFFVNGRYFRSPYLHKAVMKAYEGVIAPDSVPSYFLYLEVPAHSLDVNVSPTKTEIKFEEDGVIFQTVYACVREALAKQSLGGSLEFDRGGLPEIAPIGKAFEQYHPIKEPSIGVDTDFNPFENDGYPSEPDTFSGPSEQPSFSGFVSKSQDYGQLFEDRTLPSTTSLILHGKYILTGVKSGLLVVHISRARERILYERFLEALSKERPMSQNSLFPEPVQVGVENRLLIEDNAELLSSLGFDLRPFGSDTIVVNGLPEGYPAFKGGMAAVVDAVIDVLKTSKTLLSETMTSSLAEKFAKAGTAFNSPMTSPIEAQSLIDALFSCSNAEFTSSGRRTMVIVPIEDFAKKF